MNINKLVENCLTKYPTHTKNFYEYCDNMGINYNKPDSYCTVESVHTRLLNPYMIDLSFLIFIGFLILSSNLVSLVGLPLVLLTLNLLLCLAILKCITPLVICTYSIRSGRDILLSLPLVWSSNAVLYMIETGKF